VWFVAGHQGGGLAFSLLYYNKNPNGVRGNNNEISDAICTFPERDPPAQILSNAVQQKNQQ
jgi:hypothetical protein